MTTNTFDGLISDFVIWDLRWLKLYGLNLHAGIWSNEIFSLEIVFDVRERVVLAIVDEIDSSARVVLVDGIQVLEEPGLRNQIPNIYIALGGSARDALVVDSRLNNRGQVREVLETYGRMLSMVLPKLLNEKKFKTLMKKNQQCGTSALAWL